MSALLSVGEAIFVWDFLTSGETADHTQNQIPESVHVFCYSLACRLLSKNVLRDLIKLELLSSTGCKMAL
jgi:hypothetical protein